MSSGRAIDLIGITNCLQEAAAATEQLAKAHVADDAAMVKHWADVVCNRLNIANVLSGVVSREAAKHLNRRSRLSEAA